jgi:two-component system, OmpR family, sensor histidine kinase BaeS
MNRSLGFKLTLATVLVSVLGLLTTLWLGQTLSTNAFNHAVFEQRSAGFLKIVTDHFLETGSWDGIERKMPRQGAPIPDEAPRDAQAPGPRGDAPFSLADIDGVLVIAGKPFQPRARLDLNAFQKTPVEISGRVVGWVIETPTRNSLTTYQLAFQRSLQFTVWLTAIVALISAILIGWLVSRMVTRPLRILTQGTQALTQQLGHQVQLESQDEFGVLANAFNQMSRELERADQQRKQMTADIAHDLGTPLTVVSGYVQSMQSGKLGVTPERLGTMQNELKLLQQLVKDLQLLSLADTGQLRLARDTVQPAQLLQTMHRAFLNDAHSKGVALNLELPESLPNIHADSERLRLALGNILSNALRHTPNGGAVTLMVKHLEHHVWFEVSDTGAGISPEQLPHIFERFYRADPHRNLEYGGTGLGLAIAKSIVELHGGRICASSFLGRGTSVQIGLQVPV